MRQAAGIDGDFRQLRFILCAKHRARQIPFLCPGTVEAVRTAVLIAYITAAMGDG